MDYYICKYKKIFVNSFLEREAISSFYTYNDYSTARALASLSSKKRFDRIDCFSYIVCTLDLF